MDAVVQAQTAQSVARPPAKPMVDRLLWRAARRFTTAFVVAVFPLLFVWDGNVRYPVSPVLPGLAILTLSIITLPIPLAALLARHQRKRTPEQRAIRATRLDQWAGLAVVAACVLFLGWLALGS